MFEAAARSCSPERLSPKGPALRLGELLAAFGRLAASASGDQAYRARIDDPSTSPFYHGRDGAGRQKPSKPISAGKLKELQSVSCTSSTRWEAFLEPLGRSSADADQASDEGIAFSLRRGTAPKGLEFDTVFLPGPGREGMFPAIAQSRLERLKGLPRRSRRARFMSGQSRAGPQAAKVSFTENRPHAPGFSSRPFRRACRPTSYRD